MVDDVSTRATTVGMRRMLLVAAALVLAIGLPLYVLPDRTDNLFSWTVQPPLTAAFLGGSYLSAMLVELLAARRPVWANARIAVPAVWLFTTLTLIVTLVHLDKFHFEAEFGTYTRFVTWVWLAVYAVVPLVLGALWLQQVRAPGTDPPRSSVLPAALRVVLVSQAAALGAIGIALLIAPGRVADALWPWQLSALTGRAVGAWLVGAGLGLAQAAWENDRVRIRPWMIGYVLFSVLQLAAVVRFAADHDAAGAGVIDWGSAAIWVYLTALVTIGAAAIWALRRPSETGR